MIDVGTVGHTSRSITRHSRATGFSERRACSSRSRALFQGSAHCLGLRFTGHGSDIVQQPFDALTLSAQRHRYFGSVILYLGSSGKCVGKNGL